jgi:hypothetical protein
MHSAYVVATTFDYDYWSMFVAVRPLTYTFVVVAWFDFRLKTFDLHFWPIVVTKGVILP